MAGLSFKQRSDGPSNGTTGSKGISLSFSSKNSSTNAPPKNNKKRPLSSLIDDEDPEPSPSTIESVTGFSSGKVITGKEQPPEKQLVIAPTKNRDWREESRKRKRGVLPAEEQARREAEKQGRGVSVKNEPSGAKEEEVKYGLILQTPRKIEGDVDVKMEEAVDEKPKTADEEALSALLSDEKKSTLMIQNGNVTNERFTARAREDAAFHNDVASRPDGASLEDYAAVPIEEFGAALLRGMGWKEGQSVGRRRGNGVNVVPKVAAPPRKGGVLGIGAKEVPGEVVDEVGAWGKGARSKEGGRKAMGVPMVMRNRVTGEVVSEEELKRRQEQAEVVLEEGKEGKRKRKRDGEGDDKKERKEKKERRRDEEDRSERREQDRSGHRKDKERRRDDERESKRDRDRERNRDRERDRERSYEHRRRDEKRRDRDRDEDRHRRR